MDDSAAIYRNGPPHPGEPFRIPAGTATGTSTRQHTLQGTVAFKPGRLKRSGHIQTVAPSPLFNAVGLEIPTSAIDRAPFQPLRAIMPGESPAAPSSI